MKQAHVFVAGFVQGVGFRQFVKRNAHALKIGGWVKNLPASPGSGQGGPDGRVEIVLQGKKEDVEKMVVLCRKGPFLSEVEGVDVVWEEAQEQYRDFSIVHQ